MHTTRRCFLGGLILSANTSAIAKPPNLVQQRFLCPPCGFKEDDAVFDQPGPCPDCGMALAPKSQHLLGTEPQSLPKGAGEFSLPSSQKGKSIRLNYYYPESADSRSSIVLIIPGSGRNSDRYRDFWMEAAVNSGSIVVALGYDEEAFDFADYQLGGVIKNLKFDKPVYQKKGRARVVKIDEDSMEFSLNSDPTSRLFNDFDRVFRFVREVTNSKQGGYDIFGHSAGGQILHRFALFQESTLANRIVAANSGFYTLPSIEEKMPFGLAGLGLSDQEITKQLTLAYQKKLILLLGDQDDSDSAGGTFLKTPTASKQGSGRLQRGKSFYQYAQKSASKLGVPLRWRLETVTNVGHDGYAMSRAAAKYLFRLSE